MLLTGRFGGLGLGLEGLDSAVSGPIPVVDRWHVIFAGLDGGLHK